MARSISAWMDWAISRYTSLIADRPWLLAFTLVMLSGCNSGPWGHAPEPVVIDKIERSLSIIPCVGQMSRWARLYNYKSEPSFLAGFVNLSDTGRWYDFSKIEITYFQAGIEGYRTGRILHSGTPMVDIDDREYDLVRGEYDIASKRARIWACGPNMSPGLPNELDIEIR
ncbi:hypothetical protein [Sphingomonas sp. Root710]|uniref:hypothetical protein n=1 Tax=Sphingomonas sp. Root710 TaxID=1736594 RepID=UPI0012E3DB92|nr:hypothetical protein [Sphingomonas sp. Root710]